jgi:hypothetical protein
MSRKPQFTREGIDISFFGKNRGIFSVFMEGSAFSGLPSCFSLTVVTPQKYNFFALVRVYPCGHKGGER